MVHFLATSSAFQKLPQTRTMFHGAFYRSTAAGTALGPKLQRACSESSCTRPVSSAAVRAEHIGTSLWSGEAFCNASECKFSDYCWLLQLAQSMHSGHRLLIPDRAFLSEIGLLASFSPC